MKKTKEETDQTIQELIEIATSLFSQKGYASVSLEEIVEEAKLTRGAIYHHFKNKKGLFAAVFEHTQKLIAEEINKVDQQYEDLWTQLIEGCRLFIESASKKEIYQIILIDGPAVLGWQRFRELDQENAMRLLQEQIEKLQREGLFTVGSPQAISHALSGAINEASIWVAEQQEREKALEESMSAIETMFEGFKKKYDD